MKPIHENLKAVRIEDEETGDLMPLLDYAGQRFSSLIQAVADNGDIDTALVTGTLKGLPARLPERIQAHWIEHGSVGKIREAA